MPRAKSENTPVKSEADVIVIPESPLRGGLKKRIVKTEREDFVDVIDEKHRVVKRVIRTITTEEFIEVLPSKPSVREKNLLKVGKVIKKTTTKAKAKSTSKVGAKASSKRVRATTTKANARSAKSKAITTKSKTKLVAKSTTGKKEATSTKARATPAKSKVTPIKGNASTKTKAGSNKPKKTPAKTKATQTKPSSSSRTKATATKAKASTTKARASPAKPIPTTTRTKSPAKKALTTPAKAKPTATKRQKSLFDVNQTTEKPKKPPLATRAAAARAANRTAKSPMRRFGQRFAHLDESSGVPVRSAGAALPPREQLLGTRPMARDLFNGAKLPASLSGISSVPFSRCVKENLSIMKQEPSAVAVTAVPSQPRKSAQINVDVFAWHVSYRANGIAYSSASPPPYDLAVLCTRELAVSETRRALGSPWGLSWDAVSKIQHLEVLADDEDFYVLRCIIHQTDVTASAKRVYTGAQRWVLHLIPNGDTQPGVIETMLGGRSASHMVFGPYAVREQAMMEGYWRLARAYEASSEKWGGDKDRFAGVVCDSEDLWVLRCVPPSRRYDVVVRRLRSDENVSLIVNLGQKRDERIGKSGYAVDNAMIISRKQENFVIPQVVGSIWKMANADLRGIWIVSVNRTTKNCATLPWDKCRTQECAALVSTRAHAIQECERVVETDTALGWHGRNAIGKRFVSVNEHDAYVLKWMLAGSVVDSLRSNVTATAKLVYAGTENWVVEKTLRQEDEEETHWEVLGPFLGRQQAVQEGFIKMKTELMEVFGVQWNAVKRHARAVVNTADEWKLYWKSLSPGSVTISARRMAYGENVSILKKREDELEKMRRKTASQVVRIIARHEAEKKAESERRIVSNAASASFPSVRLKVEKDAWRDAEEDFMMF